MGMIYFGGIAAEGIIGWATIFADQAATGPAQSEPMASVRGLVKRYGSHEAVAGIDLEMRQGEIFAFLSPNGAGKTTTVEMAIS